MPEDTPVLFDFLTHMGDNCLILAHRTSEWCGHAPVLEEDIALANIALDLIGQTQLWLSLAAEVENAGRNDDELAYHRDAIDFRNLLLVEQSNGDFAKTLMRQYLFDAWHLPMLQALKLSSHQSVADIAEKVSKEVAYHLERSADLVVRLGDGSAESHHRMQTALDELWPYSGEFFVEAPYYGQLVDAGMVPATEPIREKWSAHLKQTLKQATLAQPEIMGHQRGGKQGQHTEALGFILAEMQFLQRAYPDASW